MSCSGCGSFLFVKVTLLQPIYRKALQKRWAVTQNASPWVFIGFIDMILFYNAKWIKLIYGFAPFVTFLLSSLYKTRSLIFFCVFLYLFRKCVFSIPCTSFLIIRNRLFFLPMVWSHYCAFYDCRQSLHFSLSDLFACLFHGFQPAKEIYSVNLFQH